MKLRTLASLLSVACLSVAACGGGSDLSGTCSKQQECAEKAGTKFSKTECENDAKADAEKADTEGCGDEYGDYASCVNGIDFQCSDDVNNKIAAECGSQVKAYLKCAE